MITPEQLRMALAGLNWTGKDLAAKAKVNANTVSRLATTGGVHATTMDKVQRTLEAAGAVFTAKGVEISKAQIND